MVNTCLWVGLGCALLDLILTLLPGNSSLAEGFLSIRGIPVLLGGLIPDVLPVLLGGR